MGNRIIVVTKWRLQLAVACLLIVIGGIALLSNNAVVSVLSDKVVRKIPIYSVDRADKKISISFDAAWGADKTGAILDILDKYKVKATFFLVGFWVDKYPDMVIEIDKRGHEIGTHSNTHPKMSTLSKEKIMSELNVSSNKISSLINKEVTVFRPPFGDYDNKLVEACEQLKLKPIQWDVDSLDWKDLTASEISNRVISKTKSGSIILCHNNSKYIVEALPLIFDKLLSSGYTFTTIGQLVHKGNYFVDSNGCQRLNS